MKKRTITRLTALFVLALLAFGAFAQQQVPEFFNYQAIVRNVDGGIVSDQDVTVRMTFLDNTTAVASDTYLVTTNDYGLINIAAQVLPAEFVGSYYADPKIKIEVDISGGFVDLGTVALASVPYAMNAGNVATIDEGVLTVGSGETAVLADAEQVGVNTTNITTLQGEMLVVQSTITVLGNTVADHTTRIAALEEAGYLTMEEDPLFMASPASDISNDDISNWNAAWGWGDHSGEGYLTEETDPVFGSSVASGITASDLEDWNQAHGWGDHSQAGYTTQSWVLDQNYLQTESDLIFLASPAAGISAQNITNWNAAWGWGDHHLAGYTTQSWVLSQNYLQTESDLTFLASPAAGISADNISNWNAAWNWGNHNLAGYTTQAWVLSQNYINTESDPVFQGSAAYGIENSDIIHWNTAFLWGNHSTQGYLTDEADPLFFASPAGTISDADLANWNAAWGWGDHHDAVQAVQDELDVTQVGAGLLPTGAYPVSAGKDMTYIVDATSLYNADILLDEAIVANNMLIASNSSAIAGNSIAIAANTTNIATNTTAISNNAARIITNSDLIGTNIADIASNEGRITVNENNIANNLILIGNNSDAISDVQDELDNTQVGAGLTVEGAYPSDSKVVTHYLTTATSLYNADILLDEQIYINKSFIDINANNIALNSESILNNYQMLQTHSDVIAQHTLDIAANLTAIGNNAGRITTNSDLIGTNIANIASNEGRITVNENNIASNYILIGNNSDAIAGVQAELDETQVGAGLTVSGAYPSDSKINTHYLATASSLYNADILLDAELHNQKLRIDINANNIGKKVWHDAQLTSPKNSS